MAETIYDPLRKKHVALTPEERVRQRFVAYLIQQVGYPASRIANEVGLRLNGQQKRCDTIVYDRKAHPVMLIEYKAETVPITQKVFDQIVRYNMVFQTPWLVVTNLRQLYCCHIDLSTRQVEFLTNLPDYSLLE